MKCEQLSSRAETVAEQFQGAGAGAGAGAGVGLSYQNNGRERKPPTHLTILKIPE